MATYEPPQAKTNATSTRVATYEPPEGAAPKADPNEGVELQAPGRSLMHGLVEMPTNLLRGAGWVGDALFSGPDLSPDAVRAAVDNPNSNAAYLAQNPIGGRASNIADVVKGAFTSDPTSALGFRDPIYPSERAISGIGQGAYFAPIAMAGAGPAGVVAELAATAASPFAGEYTIEGLTPEGEEPSMGAQLAGTIAEIAVAIPVAMTGNFGPAASTGKKAITRLSKIRAQNLAKKVTPAQEDVLRLLNKRSERMWRAMHPGTDDISKAPTYELEDLFDGSAFIKSKFPVDADGEIDYIAAAAELLDEDLAKRPTPLGRSARPSQVGEREGVVRDTFRRMEEGLFREQGDQGDRWANVVGGQQAGFVDESKSRLAGSLAPGSPQQYTQGAQDNLARIANDARESWRNLNFGEMPEFDIDSIKGAADQIAASADGITDDLLPRAVKDISKGKLSGKIDMERIQTLRSRLTATMMDADTQELYIKSAQASELRDALDDAIESTLDNVQGGPESLGQLKQARSDWKSYKAATSFDKLEGGDLVRLLQTNKNPSARLGSMVTSSVPDARKAISLAEGDPDMLNSLRRSAQIDLLGSPNPNQRTGFSKTTSSIRKALNDKNEAYTEILGQEWVDDVDSMIEAIEQTSSGRVGTLGMETSTGSASRLNEWQRAGAALSKAAKNPLESAGEAVSVVLAKAFEDEADKLFLLQTIIPDRELLRDSLKLPTEIDIPNYLLRLERNIARAKTLRQSPQSAARVVNKMQQDKKNE